MVAAVVVVGIRVLIAVVAPLFILAFENVWVEDHIDFMCCFYCILLLFNIICVYLCVFCAFVFHTAYMLCYCQHSGVDLMGLKPGP